MTLVAYWGAGLPVGYVLGLTDLWVPAMGPAGFWIGLVSGLTAAAVLLGIRLTPAIAFTPQMRIITILICFIRP